MNRCSNRNRSVSEVVIGIDHGYGNIKTANTCFRAGVTAYDKEPYFIIGSLQYYSKWYQSLLTVSSYY